MDLIEDYVVVLGSGESINRLSSYERRLLNSCPSKIAINKYAAFAYLAQIYPTHVFFTDDYYESGRLFFRYLVDQVTRLRLNNLTFIVSQRPSQYLILNNGSRLKIRLKKIIGNFICAIENRLLSFEETMPLLKKTYSILFREPKEHFHKFIILPRNSSVQVASIAEFERWGTHWAASLDETLYHYKGSLSSVLNYISIFFPNKKVILAGVDFNTPDYFYEKELSQLNFNTRDWTYELRQKEQKHYSVIETDGRKMDDVFPDMINYLNATGNRLYSINPNSYLVEKGFVEYLPLDEI